jgi:ABC-type sulfate/molybdate transport systems ATPase subunit
MRRRELRAVHEELRGTTILATRDPLDAIMTADRIVVMNQGRVRAGWPAAGGVRSSPPTSSSRITWARMR